MKLYKPLWFEITLYLMFLMYTVTLISYLTTIESLTYHLGIFALVFIVFYFAILVAILMMLRGLKLGYYIFLASSLFIFIVYLIQGDNFSLEQAILRPIIFSSLVVLGVNSKK